MPLALGEQALVHALVRLRQLALAVPLAVHPLPGLDRAFLFVVGAFPVSEAVVDRALVFRSIREIDGGFTCGQCTLEFA